MNGFDYASLADWLRLMVVLLCLTVWVGGFTLALIAADRRSES